MANPQVVVAGKDFELLPDQPGGTVNMEQTG